jgi:hypothetical protein
MHIKYKIVIVEQNNEEAFRKATLINAGMKHLLEEMKLTDKDSYFAMHDIDTVPIGFTNYYPPEIGVINKLYGYVNVLCGAFTFNGTDYQKMNGFSNLFEGWGGEDADAHRRAIRAGLIVNHAFNCTRDKSKELGTQSWYQEFDDPMTPQAIRSRLTSANFRKNRYLSTIDRDFSLDGYNQLALADIKRIENEYTTKHLECLWLSVDTANIPFLI